MKPITEHIPKPLLTVVNRTLLDIHISELQDLNVTTIGINLYHRANIIHRYLKDYAASNIVSAVEPELRGTGGALLNFKHFDNDDVLVVSCDSISDWNFQKLSTFHNTRGAVATLLLSQQSGQNTVELDDGQHVVGFGSSGTTNRFYDFTGTAMYSKEVFSYLPGKNKFSFIELISHIMNQGGEVCGYPTDMMWYNINTIESYFKIHEDILQERTVIKGINTRGCQYIDPSSDVQTNRLSGFLAIGANCVIGSEVDLNNTIIFSGSTIEQGEYRNCIVSDDFCIQVVKQG